jgi:opacity protein-like surface antigen
MIKAKSVIAGCLIGFFLLINISEVEAKQTKRNDKWEASFQLINSQSDFLEGVNGSSLNIDSDIGWGFTLGYNLNEHFLINFDWVATTPNYQAIIVEENATNSTKEVNHSMNLYNTNINAIYHFSTEQFTPFIQAGVGWSFIDSNIADGPPSGVCWWDPFWGYICDSYQDTYNDTRFSYSIGAGIRYELDNSVFFRASYQMAWIDFGNTEDANLGIVHLEVGSIF